MPSEGSKVKHIQMRFPALPYMYCDSEPILPMPEYASCVGAPETPGGPLALKDDLILVSF